MQLMRWWWWWWCFVLSRMLNCAYPMTCSLSVWEGQHIFLASHCLVVYILSHSSLWEGDKHWMWYHSCYLPSVFFSQFVKNLLRHFGTFVMHCENTAHYTKDLLLSLSLFTAYMFQRMNSVWRSSCRMCQVWEWSWRTRETKSMSWR